MWFNKAEKVSLVSDVLSCGKYMLGGRERRRGRWANDQGTTGKNGEEEKRGRKYKSGST